METVEMILEFIVCEEDEVQTTSSAPSASSIFNAPVTPQIEDVIQPSSSTPNGKYQRPDVTLFDRLEIVRRYLNPNRPWGEVTKMAKEYALSRVTIGSAALTTSICHCLTGNPLFSAWRTWSEGWHFEAAEHC